MQDSTLSRRRMLALSAAASASAVMPLPGCSSDTPSPESESVEQIRARKQKEAAQAETDSLANLNLLMKAMAMYEASHARYPAAEAINSQWLEKANPDNDYKKVARIYKHLMQRLAVTEDTIADQLGLKVEDVRRKVNGLDYEYKRRKRRGLPVDASKYEPIPFYGMSWRVTLLPYVDRQDLYDEYRPAEPWNSLHNRKIMEQMPDIYRAPGSKCRTSARRTTWCRGATGRHFPKSTGAASSRPASRSRHKRSPLSKSPTLWPSPGPSPKIGPSCPPIRRPVWSAFEKMASSRRSSTDT